MTNTDVAHWGPLVTMALMWGSGGFAMAEGIAMACRVPVNPVFRKELLRSLPWAVGLAVAQLAVVVAGTRIEAFRLAGNMAYVYLVFAMMAPALWASGKASAAQLNMPTAKALWQPKTKFIIMAACLIGGVALSLFLIEISAAKPGDAIRELSQAGKTNGIAMPILMIWLIINAPWQEELIFRHWLLPKLTCLRKKSDQRPGASATAMTLAVIFTALLFSLGHAAHMDPAWPKLVQTFVWGLMLGGLRVWLGTPYAVALHLMLNLSAPFIAPYLA